jgi:undecaprenyl diphosphate synthase
LHSGSAHAAPKVPEHIAIVMDGNGRWATQRFLPRVAGHKKGVDAVRETVKNCARRGVKYLTLFAFSSENWRRPIDEVNILMGLFAMALEKEANELAKNNVRLRVVGDLTAFQPKLRELITKAELITQNSTGLVLTVAANYGGRWDIVQATQKLVSEHPEFAQNPLKITEADLAAKLVMAYAPEPDLFIRTGGEHRVSNFLLWQLAYTEYYFTDVFWPDFDEQAFEDAIRAYSGRERRFGQTSQQLLVAAQA